MPGITDLLSSLFANQYLRYDLAVIAGGALLVCLVRLLAGRLAATQTDWPGPRLILVLHLLVLLLVCSLNADMIAACKKKVDTINALQITWSIAHGDLNPRLWQFYPWDARMTLFSLGYTIVPFLWLPLYLLWPEPAAFITAATVAECCCIFAAGWLLAKLAYAATRQRLVQAAFLFAYDLCFIVLYISFADLNATPGSLLFIALFITTLHGQRLRAAALWFCATLAVRDMFLPLLLILVVYHWRQGLLRPRAALLFIVGGCLAVPIIYHFLYPALGLEWLKPGGEMHLTAAGAADSLLAAGCALAFFIIISGGTLLTDALALAGCLAVFAVLLAANRFWNIGLFYMVYTRFFWPLPFLALLTAVRRKPQRAVALTLTALAANIFLTYMLGPLPGTRMFNHAKSAWNRERFSPHANQDALATAIAWTSPGMPIAGSKSVLQRLANRTYAYPAVYPFTSATNPVQRAHPPEQIILDLYCYDFLEVPTDTRIAVYRHYRDLLLAGEFSTLFYRDGVALLQRVAPGATTATGRQTGDTQADMHGPHAAILRDLETWQRISADDLLRIVVMNEHNQAGALRSARIAAGLQ